MGKIGESMGTSRPLLLDLFCGAGGAAMGYHRAGFDVVGVDLNPQPNYPFEFHRGDALDFLRENAGRFAAIHASPPCQAYSRATDEGRGRGVTYPDLIDPTMKRLRVTGKPWVVENVPGSPLRPSVILCGTMFDLGWGMYELRRHRLFQASFPVPLPPPCRHRGRSPSVYGGTAKLMLSPRPKSNYSVSLPVEVAFRMMGIDWMDGWEASEAIPPAYTEWVGRFLLNAVRR